MKQVFYVDFQFYWQVNKWLGVTFHKEVFGPLSACDIAGVLICGQDWIKTIGMDFI